eukprot:TRINITY_DN969_c0_g1::TRINITY_DN969_c0_g1_i1::g.16053::m.16053 TRINITY_DN969_c0_g1::TRINITY_DN969_c0_g1_i1::g.16053  ORF type:complete len:425 (-),score=130.98,sp/P05089/ARGI1_HUMAN/42.50/5e-78,Arginase/PF00491.16/7.3e-68 TRINITY_DN969_c0_g1_i1:322-1551(-)
MATLLRVVHYSSLPQSVKNASNGFLRIIRSNGTISTLPRSTAGPVKGTVTYSPPKQDERDAEFANPYFTLPACDSAYNTGKKLPSRFISSKTVSMVDAGICHGQPLAGVSLAPQALRNGGLLEQILELGWTINDSGALEFAADEFSGSKDKELLAKSKELPNFGVSMIKHAEIVGWKNRILYEKIRSLPPGDFHITLGGDHCIALGSIAGLLTHRPDMGVLWLDAHADINTPYTSSSGNIHGMPVSFLMKLFPPENVPGFEWMKDAPRLDPKKIVYVGLRDLDEAERRIIYKMGIKAFSMEDIDRIGIGAVMEQAIAYLSPYGLHPIHLSYDIDVVDPVVAPSTGTAVVGGLTYREAHYALERVARSECLSSIDLVEVNPDLASTADDSARTVQMGLRLLLAGLGKRIL